MLLLGGNAMDEEQKKWSQQFTANFGAREFVRLGCAVLIWQTAGIGLTLISRNAGLALIFQSVMFRLVFANLATNI
jgi:hypothetical protein